MKKNLILILACLICFCFISGCLTKQELQSELEKQYTEKVKPKIDEAGEAIEEKTDEYKDIAKDKYNEAGEVIQEKTDEYKDIAKDKYNEAGEAIQEKTDEYKEKAQDTIDEKTGEYKEKAQDFIEEKADEYKDIAKEKIDQTVEAVEEEIYKQLADIKKENTHSLHEKIIVGDSENYIWYIFKSVNTTKNIDGVEPSLGKKFLLIEYEVGNNTKETLSFKSNKSVTTGIAGGLTSPIRA